MIAKLFWLTSIKDGLHYRQPEAHSRISGV